MTANRTGFGCAKPSGYLSRREFVGLVGIPPTEHLLFKGNGVSSIPSWCKNCDVAIKFLTSCAQRGAYNHSVRGGVEDRERQIPKTHCLSTLAQSMSFGPFRNCVSKISSPLTFMPLHFVTLRAQLVLHARLLTGLAGLIVGRSHAGDHSCCELMSASATLCPQDSISPRSSMLNLSTPSSVMSPEPCGGRAIDRDVLFETEDTVVSYCCIAVHCGETLLLPRLREAQIWVQIHLKALWQHDHLGKHQQSFSPRVHCIYLNNLG